LYFHEEVMKTSDDIIVRKCPSCGCDVPADAAFRQCPKCLLTLGLSGNSSLNEETTLHEITNKTIGDYDILERLGRGGMGVVHKARHRSLNRIVALKTVRVGELASPADLARFRREAEAAAKLDHPNIVPIYEVGEHEATPFLVMRYIQGASLADKLAELALPFASDTKTRGRSSSDRRHQIRIARILALVARAVHYAHERGVLHRDLKPSNILLDQEEVPHLTDFGIAKLVDQESALTQTAELLGTPGYMSPEQATGKSLNRAADIYSLGAILYELLTGRPPFRGERPVETLRQVIEDEPPNPLVLNPLADTDLATICLKCLDKSPVRRYESALALAEDLERWQRHEPILARPAGPILRLQRWTARNPALAMLIVGLCVGLSVTLVLLMQTREEKRRKSIALAILRTESARQLQEIWDSPSPFFAIRSETLAAMAGKEPAQLIGAEARHTIAFIAQGNPLNLLLGAAPLLEHVERSMSANQKSLTRVDLRLYKSQSRAVEDFVRGDVDLIQMNAREFLRAKERDAGIQPLVRGVRPVTVTERDTEGMVVFTRANSGIKTLPDLSGKSFLFGTENSSLTFWTKVRLAEAGITARDLSKIRFLNGHEKTSDGGTLAGPELDNPFSDMTSVEAVSAGTYDAGVAREIRVLQVAARENLVVLDKIQDSRYIIAGHSSLSPRSATNFQKAMTSLTDSRMLQMFRDYPAQFENCSDSDFAEIRAKLHLETLFDTGQ
jgi:ABC-type phosphate/phosphonate transport system substrate-binding protein/tRNA A-37 threonylcarbamoyl transferase component Bud32